MIETLPLLFLLLLVAYLYGSVPFGLLLARARGIDLLETGSGRTGATNTLRTLGRGSSAVALIGDFSKGIVAIVLARILIGTATAEIIAGLAAVAGHNWSVYIGFRGGRGVTTSAAVLAALAFPVAILAIITFGAVTWASRYVSLASILSSFFAALAMALLVYLFYLPAEYLVFTAAAAALIVIQHKDNIQRLLAGTERRVGEKAGPVAEP